MWQVVYIAPNQPIAEMLQGMLNKEGFLVMLRTAGVPHQGPSAPHEVLVPESEAEEAQQLIHALIAAAKRGDPS